MLIGSLATGGYVPGPGDIDQITILRQDAAPGTEDRVRECIDSAAAAYGREVHLAPIVYRRADLERPWPVTWDLRAETRHLVTIPEELLRIHDHGQVVYGGSSSMDTLPAPTPRESLPVIDDSDVGIVTSNGCIRGWILRIARIFPLGLPSR